MYQLSWHFAMSSTHECTGRLASLSSIFGRKDAALAIQSDVCGGSTGTIYSHKVSGRRAMACHCIGAYRCGCCWIPLGTQYHKGRVDGTYLRIAYILSCTARRQFVHPSRSRRLEVLCAVQKQKLERRRVHQNGLRRRKFLFVQISPGGKGE